MYAENVSDTMLSKKVNTTVRIMQSYLIIHIKKMVLPAFGLLIGLSSVFYDFNTAWGNVPGNLTPAQQPPFHPYASAVPDNYSVNAAPPFFNSYVAENVYGTEGVYPQQAMSGGYLAMGNGPVFRQSNTIPPAQQRQTLVPRYPSYDHWSEGSDQPWLLQLMPQGLLFPSYLAGAKESRMASMWSKDENFGWVWDATLGGRAGLIRFGTSNALMPEGIQLDLEGAVQLRMDIEHDRDMMANDFRFGVPLTFGGRKWQFKTGYYHVSSHLGDEYLLRSGDSKINYVRDAFLFAVSQRFWDDWRVYGETAWAFNTGIETKPWEFQFGLEYAPIWPAQGFRGTPFAAVNLHLFEELNFNGYLCCQVGWQWRGSGNQLFRLGLQYLNGHDDQFQFHQKTTNKIGFGIWYDF